MKRNRIHVFLFVAIILLGALIWDTYNGLIKRDETVRMAWSQVENQYQRRADLIPNLVETVKGYASHEQETFIRVIEARAQATQTKVSVEDLNAESLQNFGKAQSELSQALARLMVVIERYPDLKANENFIMLQGQLEGTENRISMERKRFNEAVNSYNTYRRKFPRNIAATILGFGKKEYLEADAGSSEAPDVSF